VSADPGVVSGFSSANDASTVTLTPAATGKFTVELRITDSSGGSNATLVTVTVTAASPPPPGGGSSSGGSGSGGGGMTAGWMAGLLLAVLVLGAGRVSGRRRRA
jgi:hypothetical protein